jgi:outer membrane lipoprotein LolB
VIVRVWLAAALVGVAAGCATTPPPRAPTDLSGRMAVRTEPPSRSFSADFDLQGDAERGQLRLTGPLGATLGEAVWQPGVARLQTGEARQDFDSLDALAQSLFGESLPLAALIEWLRGRPWPGAPSVARAGGFDQLGWAIDLSGYLVDGVVVATRARGPAVSVRVRLERGG